MGIPLRYSFRNLVVRRTTTLMTAFGIGLTAAVLMAVLALITGLRTSFEATAHPLNVLVMRKGSTAELVSIVLRSVYQDLKWKPGIARTASGEPLASLEMVTMLNTLKLPSGKEGMGINVRALTPTGMAVREYVRIANGRMFTPGTREMVVGRSIAERYPGACLGCAIPFGRARWTVVGIMDAGQSAVNSEIFADLNLVAADQNREQALSSVLIRASDPVAREALIHNLEFDQRLNVIAEPERDYYLSQTSSALPIQFMGTLVATIMAIGSAFAAMNTMYAAVARRSAEIGTLRVLGFSRAGILASFLIEAVTLSFLGGGLGCLLVLPVNRIRTQIGSFTSFNEISFNFTVTPQIMLAGLLFAVLMGALGGFFPARMAARREILAALRQG
jgi:putative ABC transport system permease protein